VFRFSLCPSTLENLQGILKPFFDGPDGTELSDTCLEQVKNEVTAASVSTLAKYRRSLPFSHAAKFDTVLQKIKKNFPDVDIPNGLALIKVLREEQKKRENELRQYAAGVIVEKWTESKALEELRESVEEESPVQSLTGVHFVYSGGQHNSGSGSSFKAKDDKENKKNQIKSNVSLN
jgi:hypothetical protein